jgi:transcription elongation factor Elf1
MKEFKFDPKIFISPPYIECPKCQNKNSFGVLSVQDQRYIRRCKECWHTANFNLPKLNKKVVYLDQFVISNMMKSLNPDTKAFKKKAVDKFWTELFSKLYRLANMQLIICPDSEFHTEESLVSPYFHELKRMYELLGHGLSFYDHETIRNFQICERATNWIKAETNPATQITAKSIIHGNKDAWCDRLYISMIYENGDQRPIPEF